MRARDRWLSSQHPYGDVITALDQPEAIDAPKLGEYIAASAPLHVADGWNYLSRAFDAIARGDRYSAYHLAYYAELRAAMSLLATEGIGVFKNRHIALDPNLDPIELDGPTHRVTWQVLSAWSNDEDKAERLLEAIPLEHRSLSEWLAAVGALGPSRKVLAKEWLRAWSLDLQILATDTTRRNEISYRPTRMQLPTPVDPEVELTGPLFQAWEVLEPSTADGSSVRLDASLLRRAIALAVKERWCKHTSPEAAMEVLKGDMSEPAYAALSIGHDSAEAIFDQAERTGALASPILARSLLMLRLASARNASLLADAEVSKADLEFWWVELGSDLGLWATPEDVDVLSDLWVDVADAMDEARQRLAAIPNGASVHAVSRVLASELPLTQFSRAPLWLLGFGG